MAENTDKKHQRNYLSKFNLVLIVIIGFVAIINESDQERRLDALIEVITSKYTVDFTVSHVQTIDNVFLLVSASQKKHLTGIKFTGRIINTQSVDQHNIVFNITVDGESKEFTIRRISSGNSTGFNVYIPDLQLEYARYAKLEFVRSQVSYRK